MLLYRRGLTKILCLTLTLAFLMLQFMLADLKNNQAQAAETGLFTDVTEDSPNFAYINYLANQKIISGFPDGTFHPQEGVTRAQAALFLVKVLGLNLAEVTESGFSDLSADHWAFAAIGAAVKAGYLQGYPDGTFRPEQPISRAEGIVLALRLSKSELPVVALPPLADVPTDH
ncbi:MAG: S-layer homology domain-containing protein [Syntrophomonadaceae bacterium]|nr:S-layer homology domain-containing protein [Syntrophomonadaceae bacterium]